MLTLGGKDIYGVDPEVLTVNYVGVIRDGEPVVVGTAE
jgi:branched-chain amino acid transport system substrate-binding protein